MLGNALLVCYRFDLIWAMTSTLGFSSLGLKGFLTSLLTVERLHRSFLVARHHGDPYEGFVWICDLS